MMVAAKTLAVTAVELFSDPRHVREARAELLRQRGEGVRYESIARGRPGAAAGLPGEPVGWRSREPIRARPAPVRAGRT
jgi:hypothetical protein